MIVTSIELHPPRDSGTNFLEPRLSVRVVRSGELVCVPIEPIDVDQQGIARPTPWRMDGDSLAQPCDNRIVGDGGKSRQIGAWTGHARGLRSHVFIHPSINPGVEADERKKKKRGGEAVDEKKEFEVFNDSRRKNEMG